MQPAPPSNQVLDPATGKPIARVANCGGAETRQAIAAAEKQFQEWGRRPGKERATILRRCMHPAARYWTGSDAIGGGVVHMAAD